MSSWRDRQLRYLTGPRMTAELTAAPDSDQDMLSRLDDATRALVATTGPVKAHTHSIDLTDNEILVVRLALNQHARGYRAQGLLTDAAATLTIREDIGAQAAH